MLQDSTADLADNIRIPKSAGRLLSSFPANQSCRIHQVTAALNTEAKLLYDKLNLDSDYRRYS